MSLVTAPSVHSSLKSELAFPAHFKWCVATSAHQIEGDNRHSDWWRFEQIPGNIADGRPSGAAADHWNRLEGDVELLAALNVNQYRFSVEWAKIEPAPGQWNQDALDHYQREIDLLRSRGIEPFITLHHFTLPQWVADRGGFEWQGLAEAFERYVDQVFTTIGHDVRDWVTINEPQAILAAGYIEGVFPPQKKDLRGVGRPTIEIIRAHARAYHRLHALARERNQPIRVGMAHHLRVFDPASGWNLLDRWAASILDQVGNWAIPDALTHGRLRLKIPFTLNVDERIPEAAGTQDFLGFNYYSRDLVRFNPSHSALVERRVRRGSPVSDLNWEIYPKGFYRLLKRISARYPHQPIVITENGTADHSDVFRSQFIVDHLKWLKRALDEGVHVENYCHWSLMDNYEWAEGFEPRFGLYEVDFSTQERRLRASGALFSEIARTNALPEQ